MDTSRFTPKNLKQLMKNNGDDSFDIHTPWSSYEKYCIEINTPPANTVLIPFYKIYISWTILSPQSSASSNDESFKSSCNLITPPTNFIITLHNDPKSSGNEYSQKVTSKWSIPIASDVKTNSYLWTVPLLENSDSNNSLGNGIGGISNIDMGEKKIKNMSLFYIRVESNAMVNNLMETVFGVVGPLTVWNTPDKENKTLFLPEKKEKLPPILSDGTRLEKLVNVITGIIISSVYGTNEMENKSVVLSRFIFEVIHSRELIHQDLRSRNIIYIERSQASEKFKLKTNLAIDRDAINHTTIVGYLSTQVADIYVTSSELSCPRYQLKNV
ncbi:13258_t:CDS:2 [Dentiscutata heterogama]|uniref:13258_t:CDS:1 n=1 Tax=Dentiscutata heterogama TaxID=1316150 RepID=A0ACA9KE62_9GLOM|nr:13258_t:CDS:2 [Dentiscutata heterogama]